MPQRIARPCRVRSCRETTSEPNGFCDQHKPVSHRWGQWQKRHGTVTNRGYGSRWQRLRVDILKRDEFMCQSCHKAGRLTKATHVDHILPKSRGGDDSYSNLQSLCATCHHRKTGEEQALL